VTRDKQDDNETGASGTWETPKQISDGDRTLGRENCIRRDSKWHRTLMSV
jgi:hypothetical protein